MNIKRFKAAGLNCIEVSPLFEREDLPIVVILHGWGEWGENYSLYAPLINSLEYRFIFPSAPFKVPGVLFSWFNLKYEGGFLSNLAPQVATARSYVTSLLDELKARYNLPANRIALGGFSVGAMAALDTGIRYQDKLAGLFSLSGFMVADTTFDSSNILNLDNYYANDRGTLGEDLQNFASSNTPVLIAHGIYDFMIPAQAGRAVYKQLKAASVPTQLYEFIGSHQFTIDEFVTLNYFLKNAFKAVLLQEASVK
jgi:phospholipase/carboxylesterase